jgi:putative integral membrane protein (TIGR02587 family)
MVVDTSPPANWRYAKGLGRAFAGAVIFGLPILMTMEMWQLGFYLDRTKLLQFALVNFLVLVGLSRLSGFEPTVSWWQDLMDALSAYGIATLASLTVLAMFAVIDLSMPTSEIVGKVAIQSVPASFGAMLGAKQLGSRDEVGSDEERQRATYAGQLFLMMAGALFLGFSVAPTEEMILIAFRMSPLHSILLVAVSILLLHGFVYAVGFKGEEKPPGPTGFFSLFFRFSIVGYAIAVIVGLYLLWTFGRIEGTGIAQAASMVAVLAFPGAVGAAIARLII